MSTRSGSFVAAMGLPGSGKSTIMGHLARTTGVRVFHEPEESAWPAAVRERERSGPFGALMWFRSIRVPMYYAAAELREAGRVALVDSYYDKLCHCYLGKPGMEWLIEPTDPYYPVACAVAELDWHQLPRADCVVCFQVAYGDWVHAVSWRDRDLDRDERFLRSYSTQDRFLEAAREYCAVSGADLVQFEHRYTSTVLDAVRLKEALEHIGVCLPAGEL